jgi:ribosomal protein S18 acetylase RimI-like enzyme
MIIRPFRPSDEAATIDLWQRCDLLRTWNDPHMDIQRKLGTQAELFLVGEIGGQLVASVMAGFDGHRGWVNYLAVSPDHRKAGLGRRLMRHIEEALKARGCPKLNLQVRTTNHAVLEFYYRIGYINDDVVSLGKRLIADAPG